ncbi:hypothetical protein BDN67DRAFT_1017055 [Paxillus ammoniavirescens]|nr:hypothetical protein BDN67DRAFT_1017055 [Paxillus ammoniavirescens]
MALSSHEYRHDADEYGKRALIVYQDIVRRHWHNLLSTTQSFDLVPIDKSMIKEIHDELLYKANKSLKDKAMQAKDQLRSALAALNAASNHPSPTAYPSALPHPPPNNLTMLKQAGI